jgi:nitric oxide dioxygenase
MTPRQIQLVQDSFDLVIAFADRVTERFYVRLLELDPALWLLMRADMRLKQAQLMDGLRAVVGNLRCLDQVATGIRAMAERHHVLGIRIADYAVVGQALLETLNEVLDLDFTHEVQAAWLTAYMRLTAAVIEAEELQPA